MSEASFFSRWSQRKQEQSQKSVPEQPVSERSVNSGTEPQACQQVGQQESNPEKSAVIATPDLNQPDLPTTTDVSGTDKSLSDEDMPDVDSLDGNSDVSGFFSDDVSEVLRKKALKAMFMTPEFNIRDGLEDYDDDFSVMKPLTEKVAAGLRTWIDEQEPEEMLEEALSKQPAPESQAELLPADSSDQDDIVSERSGAEDEADEASGSDESRIKHQKNNALQHEFISESTDAKEENTGLTGSSVETN
ncbi:DUF3306 domain-containing protein [Oceanospirillum sediminis]|uniref:DUF3306 domain-containing protein n=1 Tax=Oceanospirillum sediminis TaxID=2760088 RepID=A0A839IUE8_9GAMM|nr:DUF3306 domain-containing protein [Oceanospirillum sediminis]MBB1488568.1 DUF3306 domain-containing protein [Oceanospirillum sediminis]